MNSFKEDHLDVYSNRHELHQGNNTTIYHEGTQSDETLARYGEINTALSHDYLDHKIASLNTQFNATNLSHENKQLLKDLVDGITSEVGRALVGLAVLQLTIKSIAPEQSIRLHKGSTRQGSFSWKEGISMRTLDRNYNTPFLRKYGLLNVNRDGVFMTRSLAENYPYSKLYKAEMRGTFNKWIAIVDALESNSLPPEDGLCYLLSILKNRSDNFKLLADNAVNAVYSGTLPDFTETINILYNFFNSTTYSARAFEITLHSFMQAIMECGFYENYTLVPLSQMRSANKKHGNIGDIEIKDGNVIIESWDAKYGKPYLRDELEELRDKILASTGVKLAGFIVDRDIDQRKDIIERANEISTETGVTISLISFKDWIDQKTNTFTPEEKNTLASHWLIAITESFAQRRPTIAPIDEPCEEWLSDLHSSIQLYQASRT